MSFVLFASVAVFCCRAASAAQTTKLTKEIANRTQDSSDRPAAEGGSSSSRSPSRRSSAFAYFSGSCSDVVRDVVRPRATESLSAPRRAHLGQYVQCADRFRRRWHPANSSSINALECFRYAIVRTTTPTRLVCPTRRRIISSTIDNSRRQKTKQNQRSIGAKRRRKFGNVYELVRAVESFESRLHFLALLADSASVRLRKLTNKTNKQ